MFLESWGEGKKCPRTVLVLSKAKQSLLGKADDERPPSPIAVAFEGSSASKLLCTNYYVARPRFEIGQSEVSNWKGGTERKKGPFFI